MSAVLLTFVVIGAAMVVVALAFIVLPPLMMNDRQGGISHQLSEDENKNHNINKRADWKFALAASVFVVALAPGLYWFSGAPETIGRNSDADAVVGILLTAAQRAQQNGDDKTADFYRSQAQLILQTSGEEQRAIILRILQLAGDAKNNADNTNNNNNPQPQQ